MFDTGTNTPADEIRTRIVNLQHRLQQAEIDAALIVQPTDLFYFSGTIQQSHLYIPAEGNPLLLARKSFERAQAESPIETILPLGSPKKIPLMLKENGLPAPRRIGLEMDVLPANLYLMYTWIFEKSRMIDISPTIRTLRAVKSPFELDLIANSCRMADRVSAHMAEILEEGLSEIALAGRVEAFARQMGHQGVVRMRSWGNELFYGHLMAGESAAVPSFLASPTGGASTSPAVAQGSGFRPIHANEPVLLDYVFATRGYLADHTRIYSIGPLPDDLLAAHEAMLALQDQVKRAARPGVKTGEIYDLARNLAIEAGYEEHFMGVGDQRIRFVGHGIGLELDEYPILAEGQKMPLKEGMVIALEPKLIFPGRGVVGIENTHVVTAEGLHQLTVYPDQVTVVQAKTKRGADA